MKKALKAIGTVALAVIAAFTFAACSPQTENLAIGKEMIKYNSQLDALTQLDAGSVDAAVIDSVMARYYATNGAYAGKIAIMEGSLAREQYGIAAKKGSEAFVSEINKALSALAANGKMSEIAAKYGLNADIAITADTKNGYESATDGSWDKIKSSGKIIIGYTVFSPIAFGEGENFTGYDIELARAVKDYLNETYSLSLELEFQKISWASKEVLIENGTIDIIWNGLTITDERREGFCMSNAYLNNDQVAVVKKSDADKFKTADDLKNAVIGVEKGSAGESIVKGE